MLTTTLIFNESHANFRYVGDWWSGGAWAASDGHSGTLSGTNDPNASASFTFPVAATAFRFYGMKHRHGGLFGICVGRNPCDPSFQQIDGFNATHNVDNGPSLLYSQTFISPSTHSVILRNRNDLRGIPPGNSQLTVVRFELDVAIPQNEITLTSTFSLQAPTLITGGGEDVGSTPATQPSNTQPSVIATAQPTAQPTSTSGLPVTPMPATTTKASLPVTPGRPMSSVSRRASSSVESSAASQQSWTQTASDPLFTSTVTTPTSVTESLISPTSIASRTSSSKPIPIGGAIGGILGGLAAIAILITLIAWFRMKRKFTSLVTTARPFHAPETSTMAFEPTTTRTTTLTGPSGSWAIGYEARSSEKRGRYRSQISTSTSNSSTGSSSRARPRGGLILPDTIQVVHTSNSISNPDTPNSRANSDGFWRELDGGPAPQHLLSNDNLTLPPDYGQLFSAHVSQRTSRLGRQTPSSPGYTSIHTQSPPPIGRLGSSPSALQPVRRS